MNLLKAQIKRQIDRTINKITENDEIKDLRDKIKLITINIYYKFCFLKLNVQKKDGFFIFTQILIIAIKIFIYNQKDNSRKKLMINLNLVFM